MRFTPGQNTCDDCLQPMADHYSMVDETQLAGWYGPVPAYQPAISWIMCPYVETPEEKEFNG